MPVRTVRALLLRYDVTALLASVCRSTALAAGLLLIANSGLQTAAAEGDTRTLSFHNTHTDENITVTFKRNGRYDDAALKKLNWFMRDWRKEQSVEMDPELFDILWEANRAVGGTQPIEVICGYRSPETNSMLRARSNGVAENSNHTRGLALDFFIPGVPLEKIREVGLRLQRGGVGFYPTSGSPFVHLDTGSVRHWPRMTYDQLAKVFPDGRTVHLPSNGQPLSNYALALADVERQGHSPSSLSLVAARNSGAVDENEERAVQQPSNRNLIADLLNLRKEKIEPVTPPPAPTTVASLLPPKPAIPSIPVPKSRPSRQIEIALHVPTPAPRPSAADAILVASADPIVTASASPAMAYAESPLPAIAAAGAKPMGGKVPKLNPALVTAKVVTAPTAIANAQPIRALGDNPWLRATMLTPSASTTLTATAMGKYEPQQLAEFVRKPASSVTMSFAAEAYSGLATERFSGSAVVFVATTTFGTRTAGLK